MNNNKAKTVGEIIKELEKLPQDIVPKIKIMTTVTTSICNENINNTFFIEANIYGISSILGEDSKVTISGS